MPRIIVASYLFTSFALVGCASTRPEPRPATVSGVNGPSFIAGNLRLPDGQRRPDLTDATVAIGWYRPAELATMRDPKRAGLNLLAWIQRLRIVPHVDLSRPGARVPFVVPYEGGPAVLVAFLDIRKAFWATVFGKGADGNLASVAKRAVSARPGETARADIVFDREVKERRLPEACSGERFELLHLDAPEVGGTIGNPTRRRVCVYRPPSYATQAKRRYPVVYVLQGLFGTDQSPFRSRKKQPHLGQMADQLAAATGREMILVSVDTSSLAGSSYFVKSPLTGDWEGFLTERVVGAIDRRYRTVASPRARGLVGHSTGGFNAMSLGIRRPDVFSAVAASGPDALDLGPWLIAEGRPVPLWLAWMRVEDAMGGSGQFVSYGADWSPDPEAARGFSWPVDLDTGRVRPEVWARWERWSPSRLLEDPATLQRVRQTLSGRILLAPSAADEFRLYPPAQRFHAQLKGLGIAHEWRVWPGGHGSHGAERLRHALAFLSARLMVSDR